MMKTIQHPVLRVTASRHVRSQGLAQTLPANPPHGAGRIAAAKESPFDREGSAASVIRIGVARVPSRRLNRTGN